MCREYKEENYVARNCDSYWRWREREVRKKLRELKEKKEKELQVKERVLRCTMQPLREVWMTIGMEKLNTHEGVTVKPLLDSGATGIFADRKFIERNRFKMESWIDPTELQT